jgi:hypothetical protein
MYILTIDGMCLECGATIPALEQASYHTLQYNASPLCNFFYTHLYVLACTALYAVIVDTPYASPSSLYDQPVPRRTRIASTSFRESFLGILFSSAVNNGFGSGGVRVYGLPVLFH